jgi:hypothetical protein
LQWTRTALLRSLKRSEKHTSRPCHGANANGKWIGSRWKPASRLNLQLSRCCCRARCRLGNATSSCQAYKYSRCEADMWWHRQSVSHRCHIQPQGLQCTCWPERLACSSTICWRYRYHYWYSKFISQGEFDPSNLCSVIK